MRYMLLVHLSENEQQQIRQEFVQFAHQRSNGRLRCPVSDNE